MIFAIDNVLTPEELNCIADSLDRADFVDGKTTAGWHAKFSKNNKQLQGSSTCAKDLRELVKAAFKRNPLFQSAVQPKIIHSLLFNRYEIGMSYGRHVDNAFMGDREFWRSDVSFTLFLSYPATYEGGELVIECSDGDRTYKLEAGSAIVYPSSSLHQVESVTDGVRLAAVGWVQSLVRDPNAREILFDLDTARRSIFAKEGKTVEFDLISKSYANLLRRWAD
ncbi:MULTISPECIES: Fe2+-dependent dioxygenase [unclassified Coleofasciculus]|uniref:Fe2+-dependent dioxygenase n=1 Tax=unclassified Coleofasciculus TaxID=2692782 RepID=UPI00188301BA|nr:MULTISPECIES: Fe2+-dependent dioxygenase [unclassified Coleofasciculus]MBE9127418.1 Fe2+-dependent dioxygenase [Coleofasciculus sp. LEGE 07081]MBE9149255.1 Fe2+-dependent dioxygenase [Coleofasciculus sp. LEGE 07092]